VAAQVLQKLGADLNGTRNRVLAQLEGYTGAWQEAPSAESIAGSQPSLPALRWRVVRALDRLGDLEAQVVAVRGDLVEIRRLLSLFGQDAPPAPPAEEEADASEGEGGAAASPS
jgi:hypothetical protein